MSDGEISFRNVVVQSVGMSTRHLTACKSPQHPMACNLQSLHAGSQVSLACWQPCSLAALHAGSLACWQPCMLAALQPCSLAALQPCSLAALQPCILAAKAARGGSPSERSLAFTLPFLAMHTNCGYNTRRPCIHRC